MLFFGIVIVLAGCAVSLLYAIYASSPEGRWRRRVRQAQQRIAQLRQLAQARLVEFERHVQTVRNRILETALTQKLTATPVEELQKTAGIGPKTIEQLRAAGLSNLAQVRQQLHRLPVTRHRASLIETTLQQFCQRLYVTWQTHPETLPLELYQQWASQQAELERQRSDAQRLWAYLDRRGDEIRRYHEQYAAGSSFLAFCWRWLQGTNPKIPAEWEQDLLLSVEERPAPPARQAPRPVRQPTPDFTELAICVAYLLARADGRLSQQEHERIAQHFLPRSSSAQNVAATNHIRALLTHYSQKQIDPKPALHLLRQHREEIRRLWQSNTWPFLVELARLGNDARSNKRNILQQIATILDMPIPGIAEGSRSRPSASAVAGPPLAIPTASLVSANRSSQTRPATSPSLPSSKHTPRDPVPHTTPQPMASPAAAPPGQNNYAPGPNRPVPTSPPTDKPEPAPSSQLNSWQARQILGFSKESSLNAQEIRKQYRERIKLYDPSQEQLKGQEFARLAQRKRDEVEAAAILLLKELGVANPQNYLQESAPPPTDYSRDNPLLDSIFQE